MAKGDSISLLPQNAPKKGEVFRHYKGDQYWVVDLALHSNDEEWMVIYEPMYENPAAKLFVRPLREWNELVEWEGKKVERFAKVAGETQSV